MLILYTFRLVSMEVDLNLINFESSCKLKKIVSIPICCKYCTLNLHI